MNPHREKHAKWGVVWLLAACVAFPATSNGQTTGTEEEKPSGTKPTDQSTESSPAVARAARRRELLQADRDANTAIPVLEAKHAAVQAELHIAKARQRYLRAIEEWKAQDVPWLEHLEHTLSAFPGEHCAISQWVAEDRAIRLSIRADDRKWFQQGAAKLRALKYQVRVKPPFTVSSGPAGVKGLPHQTTIIVQVPNKASAPPGPDTRPGRPSTASPSDRPPKSGRTDSGTAGHPTAASTRPATEPADEIAMLAEALRVKQQRVAALRETIRLASGELQAMRATGVDRRIADIHKKCLTGNLDVARSRLQGRLSAACKAGEPAASYTFTTDPLVMANVYRQPVVAIAWTGPLRGAARLIARLERDSLMHRLGRVVIRGNHGGGVTLLVRYSSILPSPPPGSPSSDGNKKPPALPPIPALPPGSPLVALCDRIGRSKAIRPGCEEPKLPHPPGPVSPRPSPPIPPDFDPRPLTAEERQLRAEHEKMCENVWPKELRRRKQSVRGEPAKATVAKWREAFDERMEKFWKVRLATLRKRTRPKTPVSPVSPVPPSPPSTSPPPAELDPRPLTAEERQLRARVENYGKREWPKELARRKKAMTGEPSEETIAEWREEFAQKLEVYWRRNLAALRRRNQHRPHVSGRPATPPSSAQPQPAPDPDVLQAEERKLRATFERAREMAWRRELARRKRTAAVEPSEETLATWRKEFEQKMEVRWQRMLADFRKRKQATPDGPQTPQPDTR